MFDASASADPLCLQHLSNDQLEEELCTRAAHIAAAECRLVLLVAELDRRGTWADQGLRSCAHWLNWRCGVSMGAAREQVRVGRALTTLPVLREAFATAELSYSKVRAVTRVANPHLEASLVEMARYATAAQLERIVREYRRAAPDEGPAALRRHAGRSVRVYTDEDGMVVIRARLSPEDGAVVVEAIEATRRAVEEDREPAPDSEDVSAETRPVDQAEAARADALVAACESVLAHGVRPAGDRGRSVAVLVHVDQQVLEDPEAEGCAHVEATGAISSHTAQRMACDAAVSRLGYRPGGDVVPEGRTREIPPSLRRAVLARDRGCRWPGCTQRRFVDVHHVQFVSQGGRTVLSNLVSACRFHHRMVHEGGYRLTMDNPDDVRIFDPRGTRIPQVPRPVRAVGPDLAAQHREAGLDLGPFTLAYCGEPFDLGLTVDCLLTCWAGASSAGTASGS